MVCGWYTSLSRDFTICVFGETVLYTELLYFSSESLPHHGYHNCHIYQVTAYNTA